MPVGTVTRGTTGTNRLRRVDRWIAGSPAFLRADDPLVVDLGYGSSGVTVFELHQRLHRYRADVRVIGIEIAPDRVERARGELARVRAGLTGFARDSAVDFLLGGFEVPLPGGRRPVVLRAFNVLRQYDVSEVAAAWETLTARLHPQGLLVDGTCDEIGRVATWIALGAEGPRSLTVSLRLSGLELPSIAAERLPKALIHRNVPGERVHDLLSDLDRQWRNHTGLAVHGARQRWIATVEGVRASGWTILSTGRRIRLGEITVPWSEVAPGP